MRIGYEIRSLGHSETSAEYAGINVENDNNSNGISGGLAGLVAVNEILVYMENCFWDLRRGMDLQALPSP